MTANQQGRIIRPEDIAPQSRIGDVSTWALVTGENGSTQMITGITEIPAGSEVPPHTHNNEEFIFILKGSGIVLIGDHENPVVEGDATHVLPGTIHRFLNDGTEPLRLLWVYGGIDTTRTLTATGETVGALEQYGTSHDNRSER